MENAERRNFVRRIVATAAMVGVGSALTSTMTVAEAQVPGRSQLTAPVEGTINGIPIKTGFLTINNFAARGNQIVAAGFATLTDVNNTTRVLHFSNLPTRIAQATCTILDLTLGPLDLTLLGLHVHLDTVHLLITANPAGGLLGQLLCSIADVFSGGGPLQRIIGLLNQLIGALSQL